MAKKTSFLDKLRSFLKDAEAEMEKEDKTEDEESDEDDKEDKAKTGDALAKILDRLKAMDEDIQELKKAKADDEEEEEDPDKKKTDDDILEAETAGKLNQADVDLYTGDSAQTILARAEILSPGIKLPTLDAKMNTKDRAAALCKCQRRALDLAFQTDAGRAAIAPFLGGKTADFAQLPAALVNAAFMGASELIKAQNNAGGAARAVSTKDFGRVKSVADINKAAQEFWANRK